MVDQTHKYCILNCRAGLTYNLEQKYCQYCASSCQNCKVNNHSACTSCADGAYYLELDACVASCSSGFLAVTVNSTRHCIPNNACDCPKLYDYISKSCVDTCPETTFPLHDTTYFCLQCGAGCKKCTSHTNCEQCITPSDSTNTYYLHQGLCLSQCPNNFFADGASQACRSCPASCQKCNRTDVCQLCETGKALLEGQCVAQCPERMVQYEKRCVSCPAHCVQCANELHGSCLQCESPFLLEFGVCKLSCAINFYKDTVNQKCLPCKDINCQACAANLTTCEVCTPGYNLVLHNNATVCAPVCLPDCLPDHCITPYTCLRCADGFAWDATTKQCVFRCIDNCLKCSAAAPTLCQNCSAGYLLAENNQACTPVCNVANCKACLTPGVCSECQPNYRLQALLNTCEAQCHDANCLSCSDSQAGRCLQCIGPYVLLNGTCAKSCLTGQYINQLTQRCEACARNCSICAGPLNADCLRCQADFALHAGECLSQCPSGYFQNSQVCEQCRANCLKCVSASRCTECQTGFLLQNEICVSQCAQGYYSYLTQQCRRCLHPCAVCAAVLTPADPEPPVVCTQCELGFQLVAGTCHAGCLSYQYLDESDLTCKPCTANCMQCSTALNCTGCIAGFFLTYKAAESKYLCVSSCESLDPALVSNAATHTCD